MTFGYVNAAAKFQTVMDRELAVAGLDNETTCYTHQWRTQLTGEE